MATTAIIVGGGLAGLAAATALARHKVRVTLLESRPRLGGRASSFIDRATGTCIDNCQHVSMGCCTNFRHFCETVGVSDLFRSEPELFFIGPPEKRDVPGTVRNPHPTGILSTEYPVLSSEYPLEEDAKRSQAGEGNGRNNPARGRSSPVINRVKASRLPAPFHLWSSFRKLPFLDRRDRRLLAEGLRKLARCDSSCKPDRPFSDWLTEQRQTPAAIEGFWNVILVSTLSETLDRISLGSARKVFVDAFLANRNGWQVQIPTVPLNELYGRRLRQWLNDRGVTLRLQSGVKRLLIDGDIVSGVELSSGERLSADDYLAAVPHHRVLSLLPNSLRAHGSLSGIGRLETAPISSVHLWFDRPITSLPHAVLIDRLSQWMFNRTLLQGKTAADEQRFYYQIVISASRHLAGRVQQQTIDEVVRELREIWPAAANARLLHSRLVTEHKAVFSPKPGAEAFRPRQQSPIGNLQLAGDWTRTGWPATMEGAVRSGYLAAENVLARHGRKHRLLQPDLPVALLSKLFLGLSSGAAQRAVPVQSRNSKTE